MFSYVTSALWHWPNCEISVILWVEAFLFFTFSKTLQNAAQTYHRKPEFSQKLPKKPNTAERKCNLNFTNVSLLRHKLNALRKLKTVWNEKEMCISELQTMLWNVESGGLKKLDAVQRNSEKVTHMQLKEYLQYTLFSTWVCEYGCKYQIKPWSMHGYFLGSVSYKHDTAVRENTTQYLPSR